VDYGYLIPNCLAQGSAPTAEDRLHERFDVVVLCAYEYQNVRLPGVETIRCPLDDDPNGPPMSVEEVGRAAGTATRVVRRIKAGKRVLVTCYMGRNRSGVVSGLALRAMGFTPRQCVDIIRMVRGPNALSNKHFVNLIARMPRQVLVRAATGVTP
jgi:protein-tyrosine phosphatase